MDFAASFSHNAEDGKRNLFRSEEDGIKVIASKFSFWNQDVAIHPLTLFSSFYDFLREGEEKSLKEHNPVNIVVNMAITMQTIKELLFLASTFADTFFSLLETSWNSLV